MTNAALVDTNHVVQSRIVTDGVNIPQFNGLITIVETDQTGPSGKGFTWDGTIFHAPPSNVDPPPTTAQLRFQSFVGQADRQDLITRLQSATPTQIDSWLTANVTTLAQARTVLGAVIKVLATMQLT